MSTRPASDGLSALRELVRERLGLWYDERKQYLLRSAVQKRVAARGLADVQAYVRFLTRDPAAAREWTELAALLANNETYFFREPGQLRAFTGPVLEHLTSTGASRPFRVWSAGCSTGEEPYTLAIALLASGRLSPAAIEVLGTDVSRPALETARRGVYRPSSFRATPPETIARWFVADGPNYAVVPQVKARVTFDEQNLAEARTIAARGRFDAIFCRNVLIYFDGATQKRVVESLAAALRPDGFLFVGHAESLFHLTDRYEAVTFDDAVVYRLRGAR